MALSSTSLKNRIKAKIEAIEDFPAPGMSPIFANEEVIQALAEAVVEEIQANAAVTVTGVQTGSSTAPGTVS